MKSFVLGQPLYRFGDLELVIPALMLFDITADIMINPGGIRPDGGSFRGYAFPHGREKVLGPTRPDLSPFITYNIPITTQSPWVHKGVNCLAAQMMKGGSI